VDFSTTTVAGFEIERLSLMLKVDVVNAHSSKDRAACRRLRFKRRLKPALVMTRRGMPMSSLVSGIASGLAADRVIAVSRPVAAALVRQGTLPWRISVVHNAVDLSRVDRVPADTERFEVDALLHSADALVATRPVVGVVSRRKDHDVLLRALAFVKTPITLMCVGFQPDGFLSRLPTAAAHRVVWVPFHDDVRAFYDRFDIVVLPSRHEGMSQGLLEAMAIGKPVIATRGGGNTDLIDDGVHGLLVPRRDPEALGRSIQRLLDDRDLRIALAAAGQQRVRTEFTIDRTLAGTMAAYDLALARRHR
jgi:glycosyltransferase involved in cell wall biosynthesis